MLAAAPAASDFISSPTKEKKVDVDIIFGKHDKFSIILYRSLTAVIWGVLAIWGDRQ